MGETLQRLSQAILDGNAVLAADSVKQALDAKLDHALILNDGTVKAMAEVGRLFEEGDYFVPEMLISARAMKTGLQQLKPFLTQSSIQSIRYVTLDLEGFRSGSLNEVLNRPEPISVSE